METPSSSKPIRIGIFDTILHAENAVQKLLDAGFAKEEITVICPDHLEKEFEPFIHQKEKKEKAVTAGVTGTAIGTVLGGLLAVAGVVTTGGIGIFAVGPLIAGTSLAGGFIGLMMRRGVEKELAHFYDQAVASGKILVAAEVHDKDAEHRLARAASIFVGEGTKPMKMREG